MYGRLPDDLIEVDRAKEHVLEQDLIELDDICTLIGKMDMQELEEISKTLDKTKTENDLKLGQIKLG